MREEGNWLKRPDFDEQGYPGGVKLTGAGRRQYRRLVLCLAAVVCVCVLAGILLYALRPKHSPKELCMYGISNTVLDLFGAKTQLGEMLKISKLAELYESETVQTTVDLSLAGTNLRPEDLGVTGLEEYVPDFDALSGIGLRLQHRANRQGSSLSTLYASYGVLRLPVASFFYSEEQMGFCLPELSKDILVASPKRLFEDWEALPVWDWMSESEEKLALGLLTYGEAFFLEQKQMLEQKQTLFFKTFGTTEQFVNEILDVFTYEAMGAEARRRCNVGGTMQLCDGYAISIDGAKLQSILEQAAGESFEGLAIEGANGGPIVCHVYLTKQAELAYAEGQLLVSYGETTETVSLLVECTGKERASDVMRITVKTGQHGTFGLVRRLVQEDDEEQLTTRLYTEGLQENWQLELSHEASEEQQMKVTAALTRGEKPLGTVTMTMLSEEQEDSVKITLRQLRFEVPDGTYVAWKGGFLAERGEQPPKLPDGRSYDLFTLTWEEFEAIMGRLRDGVERITKLVDSLM